MLPQVLACVPTEIKNNIEKSEENETEIKDKIIAEKYDFVMTNIRIFDGKSVIPKTNLYVRDGIIVAIGDNLLFSKDTQVINGENHTVLPGLIDAHSHPRTVEELRQTLAFGVTTTMDMMAGDLDFVKAQRKNKSLEQADMLSAGFAVTVPGGHGDFGPNFPKFYPDSDVALFVKQRITEGSDYIKIVIETGVEGFQRPSLNQQQVNTTVETAHSLNVLAFAHVGDKKTGEMAIDAGVDALMHVPFPLLDAAAMGQKLAAANIAVAPTVGVMCSLFHAKRGAALLKENPSLERFLWPGSAAKLRHRAISQFDGLNFSCADMKKVSIEFLKAGVEMLVSTDAGIPSVEHGISVHDEMMLLSEAGFNPIEILQAATFNAARVFRLGDRGEIKVGLRADLLLVKGDPTVNIKDTLNIEGIWKKGVSFDRERFAEEIKLEYKKKADASKLTPNQLISDFNNEVVNSHFGFGFQEVASPGSSVLMEVKESSLFVKGEISSELYSYVGVNFHPNILRLSSGADFSKSKGLRFRVKGDGRDLKLALFFSSSFLYSELSFQTEPGWSTKTFSFDEFENLDLRDISLITWYGVGEGPIAFQLDDIQLYSESY